MKKQFPTFIHDTAAGFEKIFVSGGKVGYQIEVAPGDIVSLIRATFADIVS